MLGGMPDREPVYSVQDKPDTCTCEALPTSPAAPGVRVAGVAIPIRLDRDCPDHGHLPWPGLEPD